MNDILEGKFLVAMGDSLIHGNILGNEATWVNKLAKKHKMRVHNAGINGNPIAVPPQPCGSVPMVERYRELPDGADYVVVLGGANDKNFSVPIGENTDAVPTTFKGAINILIDGLTEKYPRAKILFMTNYNRWPSVVNGNGDIDFCTAMEEVCKLHSIPCFNNYFYSGISFRNKSQLSWADEGLSLGEKENHHFSDEAYDWLLPRYEALLMGL